MKPVLTARMLGALTFSVVLGTILPPCEGINAIITPKNHAIFEAGSNISLHCTLNSPADQGTAANIVWHRNGVELPSDYSTTINETVSRLYKSSAVFSDTGNYECSFPGDSPELRAMRYLTVAAPPDPVRNLTCRTPNTVKIYCQWWDGLTYTNVRNTHPVHWVRYRPPFKPVRAVNDCVSHQDGSYSCSFEIDVDDKIQVVVMTENVIGSADSSVVLDPSNEVIPNEPTNIVAVPGSLNESRYLSVTWGEPDEWHFFLTLRYRIRYTNLATQESVEEPETIEARSYKIEGLVRYTNYEIGISARSITADPSRKDLYWSEWGKTRQKTDEGAPFGKASDVTIGLETEGSSKDLRYINLHWKPIPDSQKGSDTTIMYEVTLSPQDFREGRPFHIHNQTVTYPFADFNDLNKYQTYSVDIQAKSNLYGDGPIENFGIVIPDRTAKSSEPQNLNVTVIDHVLKITWEPPKNPNGFVEKYRVTVAGNVTLITNQMSQAEDRGFTELLEYFFNINCTDHYSAVGETLDVSVSAFTRNFTDHLFEGAHAHFVVDRVCSQAVTEHEGINALLWAILVPMMVVICCIIVIAVLNFCKEFWVEPPDPEYPKSIISNGQFKDINFHLAKPREREHFDEPRSQTDTTPNSQPEISREQQTDISQYHLHPSNLPKVLRNLSHDSGFSGPESPFEEAIDIDSVFHNHSFQGEDILEGSEFRPPMSVGTTDDRKDLRNSVFSSGSADSGAEVRSESVAADRSLIMSTNSTTAGQSEMVDPYLKVSELPPSSLKTSSPPTMVLGMEQRDDPDDRVSLVCDEVDEGREDHEYLTQYQLSPISRNMPEINGVNPYLAMAALTPAPTSLPSGYIPTEDLMKSLNSPVLDHPSTPDGYKPFALLEKKRELPGLNNNGYVDHGSLEEPGSEPVPKCDDYVKHQTSTSLMLEDYVKDTTVSSPEVDDYVKHQSISSSRVDYSDDYDPDFVKEVRVDEEKVDLCKQLDDGCVEHPVLGSNLPTSMQETTSVLSSSGSSTDSQMPYCKIAQGD